MTEEEKWEGLVEQLLKLDDDTLEKLSFEIWGIQMGRLFEEVLAERQEEAIVTGSNVVQFKRGEE